MYIDFFKGISVSHDRRFILVSKSKLSTEAHILQLFLLQATIGCQLKHTFYNFFVTSYNWMSTEAHITIVYNLQLD